MGKKKQPSIKWFSPTIEVGHIFAVNDKLLVQVNPRKKAQHKGKKTISCFRKLLEPPHPKKKKNEK